MKYYPEKKRYEVIALSPLGNIISEVENFNPDLILIDIRMGNKLEDNVHRIKRTKYYKIL